MKANTLWSWIKKWGLWILAGLTFILFVVAKILPKPKDKKSILRRAHDGAEKIKVEVKENLDLHRKKMADREIELENIKAISDEEERLKALADFANRGNP